MRVLLTGGTGFIGSHTAVALVAAGHDVVLFDNLSNSSADVVDRLKEILGAAVPLFKGDVRESAALDRAFTEHRPDSVIHLAGLKSVADSAIRPLDYFDTNVGGTLTLMNSMRRARVKRLVFSSSATVYGIPRYLPLDEKHVTGSQSPYGRTKLHVEEMLSDYAKSDPSLRISSLRYFNPAGCHPSALIGEVPAGTPNNLMPYITRVAAGRLPHLSIYGDDYETSDGTCIRDFIHVDDVAAGHVAALAWLKETNCSYDVFNLGTGVGTSVMQVVKAFEDATHCSIPYRIGARRQGDVPVCYANPLKANRVLKWSARRGLREICQSAWTFESRVHG